MSTERTQQLTASRAVSTPSPQAVVPKGHFFSFFKSLFLSNETWGVLAMRLGTGQQAGVQGEPGSAPSQQMAER